MWSEVCCADDVNNNVEEAWKIDGGDGETSQSVNAGSASVSNPPQLNADSRESLKFLWRLEEETQWTISNLVTLSEKLELDLQEDDFVELLAVQHEELTNEDLMELQV